MKRSDFHYDLPPELIAQEPRPRGGSRMMIVTPGATPPVRHGLFAELPSLLGKGDVLVLNDTRVFPARLFARPKGNMQRGIEILLTRKLGTFTWEAWCRPARRVRPGDTLHFSDRLTADVLAREEETVRLRFQPEDESLFWSEIESVGVTPTPPYIARTTPRESDRQAYQTVYAGERGAVAAPTAGLHFTPEILREVESRGAEIVRVTLHVGIGTFQPVKVDDIEQHQMQSETYRISREAAARLNAALEERRRIVAVGTTSVRTLESAIRAGGGRFEEGERDTSIFLRPGSEFRAVDALLTNFHLPESTLFMLVSAFAGLDTMRSAYAEAIARRYLFYSYGDCMFITRRDASD